MLDSDDIPITSTPDSQRPLDGAGLSDRFLGFTSLPTGERWLLSAGALVAFIGGSWLATLDLNLYHDVGRIVSRLVLVALVVTMAICLPLVRRHLTAALLIHSLASLPIGVRLLVDLWRYPAVGDWLADIMVLLAALCLYLATLFLTLITANGFAHRRYLTSLQAENPSRDPVKSLR